jgi:hypothetical protein
MEELLYLEREGDRERIWERERASERTVVGQKEDGKILGLTNKGERFG